MNVPASTVPSTFVTSLAWVLLVFNGLSVFGALMQNMTINIFLAHIPATPAPSGQLLQALPITFFRIVGLLFLGFAVFTTYAAYALLKRRNWARLTYIALFALGIASNMLFAVGFGLGFGWTDFPTSGGNAVPGEFHAMLKGMAVAFAAFAVAMSVLFGWLIKRLSSPSIKAEFNGAVGVA